MIPHEMYFNSGFFSMFIFFLWPLTFFLGGENIKKVMYRSTSSCLRRQISPLRMLNSACSFSALYVTTFYTFAIYSFLFSVGHQCYEFTRYRRTFFSRDPLKLFLFGGHAVGVIHNIIH